MNIVTKKQTKYTVTLELDRCDLEVLIMALRFGLDHPSFLLPKVVAATVEEITKNLEELYTS